MATLIVPDLDKEYYWTWVDLSSIEILVNVSPHEQRWYEYHEANIDHSYICGYLIPSEDAEVANDKMYYIGPFVVNNG